MCLIFICVSKSSRRFPRWLSLSAFQRGLDRRSEPIRAKCHVPTYLGHRDLDLHGPKKIFATMLAEQILF